MNTSKFLEEKLNGFQNERKALKEKLDILESKLKINMTSLSKAPRESEKDIQDSIDRLEFQHTTSSQNSEQERNYLKEKEKLKQKLKAVINYASIQSDVNDIRTQREVLRKNLRDVEASIRDCRQGIRRFNLATRASCSISELIEQKFSLPLDKVNLFSKRVILNIEEKFGVSIEQDRTDENTFHVLGRQDNIHSARDEMIRIISIVSVDLQLTEETVVCLLLNHASLLQSLQEAHNAKFDINRVKNICKITGYIDNVNAASTALKEIESLRVVVDIDPTSIPSLIGKGGATIRSLGDESRMVVDIEKATNKIIIMGFKADVEQAAFRVRSIVEDNREVDAQIQIDKHTMFGCIIGNGGENIKKLQKEFGAIFRIEKSSDSNGVEVLHIRGASSRVVAAKQRVDELIHAYIANTDTLEISEDVMPMLLGKKGVKINAIRDEHKKVNIDIDGFIIKLSSPDKEARSIAKQSIIDFVNSNYVRVVHCTEDDAISLKSTKALDIRTRLIVELKLSMDIEATSIRLRGLKTNVEKGSFILQEFFNQFQSHHVQLTEEDCASLMNTARDLGSDTVSGEDLDILNPIRYAENKFAVETFLNRKMCSLTFRGLPTNILLAEKFMNGVLCGEMECGSHLFPIDPSMYAVLIGKGGSNLKRLESQYIVKFDILKSKNLLRIRGSPTRIAVAKTAVLDFLDETKMSITLSYSIFASTKKVDIDEICNRCERMFSVEITIDDKRHEISIRGALALAEDCKSYVNTYFSGEANILVGLMESQLQMVGHKVEKISKALIDSFPSHNLFIQDNVLHGTCPFVQGSKFRLALFALLEKFFPGQFVAIQTQLSCIHQHFSPKQLRTIRAKSNALITVDIPTECIFIIGSVSDVHSANQLISASVSAFNSLNVDVPILDQLLPIFVGKNGSAISTLEKQCDVSIIVNRVKGKLEIRGASAEKVKKAVSVVRDEIDRAASQYCEFDIEESLIGSLIGKQGATINKFKEESKAKIELDKIAMKVIISGNPEDVKSTRESIVSFLAEERRNNHILTLFVPSDAVPMLIGSNGDTIKQLQSESSTKIDLKANEERAIIKGSVSNCSVAKKLIQDMLVQNDFPTSAPAVEEHGSSSTTAPPVDNSLMNRIRVPPGASQNLVRMSQEKMLSKSAMKRLRKKEKSLQSQQQDARTDDVPENMIAESLDEAGPVHETDESISSSHVNSLLEELVAPHSFQSAGSSLSGNSFDALIDDSHVSSSHGLLSPSLSNPNAPSVSATLLSPLSSTSLCPPMNISSESEDSSLLADPFSRPIPSTMDSSDPLLYEPNYSSKLLDLLLLEPTDLRSTSLLPENDRPLLIPPGLSRPSPISPPLTSGYDSFLHNEFGIHSSNNSGSMNGALFLDGYSSLLNDSTGKNSIFSSMSSSISQPSSFQPEKKDMPSSSFSFGRPLTLDAPPQMLLPLSSSPPGLYSQQHVPKKSPARQFSNHGRNSGANK